MTPRDIQIRSRCAITLASNCSRDYYGVCLQMRLPCCPRRGRSCRTRRGGRHKQHERPALDYLLHGIKPPSSSILRWPQGRQWCPREHLPCRSFRIGKTITL